MEPGATLGEVVENNTGRNPIFGTYDPGTETVLVEAPDVSIPFKHTVSLRCCDFKIIGQMPLSSNGYVLVSFTHVNIRAWNVFVRVPVKFAQSRQVT